MLQSRSAIVAVLSLHGRLPPGSVVSLQEQLVRAVDAALSQTQRELAAPVKRVLPSFPEWSSIRVKDGADETMIGFYKCRSRNRR